MMKYIGNGTSVVPGLPLRDLTDKEVKKHGKDFILSTGLYEEEAKKTAKKTVKKDGE